MINWLKSLWAKPEIKEAAQEVVQEAATFVLERKRLPKNDGVKAKDFPKEEYTHYWETFNGYSDKEGFTALVKFNPWKEGSVQEVKLSAREELSLRRQVNEMILQKMKGYKKG